MTEPPRPLLVTLTKTTPYGTLPVTRPLSPETTALILQHPSSRYSKLSSVLLSALSRRPNAAGKLDSISLPRSIDPEGFGVLVHFLETSDAGVYDARTGELRGQYDVRTGLVKEGRRSKIPREDVRGAFRELEVEWPGEWFGVEEEREREEEASEMERELDIGGSRRREDYSSEEVYNALREQVEGDLVNYSIGEEKAGSHATDLPSYDESQQSSSRRRTSTSYPADKKSTTPPPPEYPADGFLPTLQSTLHTSLTTLLLSHIRPAIHSQARAGMFKGTFVLLPLDQTPLFNLSSHPPRDEEIVTSFEKSNDFARIIHLPGGGEAGYTAPFLVQPIVMQEIRRKLEEALAAEGQGASSAESGCQSEYLDGGPEMTSVTRGKEKRSWLGAFSGRRSRSPPAQQSSHARVSEVARMGKVKVEVRKEEVWVRRETDMGLFETVQGSGVVVFLEVIM